MYVTSPHGHVFALNPMNGALKWTFNPDIPPLSQLAICCGQTNRGVAVGDGKVFVGQLDATLVALDANSGNVIWKTTVDDYHLGWTETMAPLFVNGKVNIGASGGEFQLRDHVSAYDAATGNLVWRFDTVPGPGQMGNDTWTGNSWMKGGRHRVDHAGGGSAARPPLHHHQQRGARSERLCTSRRQPVHRFRGRPGCEYRRVQVALPGGSPRSVGLRPDPASPSVHRDKERPANSRPRAREQERKLFHS